jgi:hypothetical protein
VTGPLLSKAAILSVFLTLGACAVQAEKGSEAMTPRTIEQVLKAHTPELMALPGVVGTAQGLCEGRPCILVFVSRKTPELQKQIPKSLEGYPVILEETGEIRALPKAPER